MAEVHLRCLGGCREVGRSAFLLDVNGKKLLIDYGISLNETPSFPLHVRAIDVDVVVISHAHLDHSGSVPLLYTSKIKPYTVSTALSAVVLRYLLADMLKLSGYYLPFEVHEVQEMYESMTLVDNDEVVDVGDVQVRFIHAGHVPGSSMILISCEGFKALYTGDINLVESQLLYPADKQQILRECPIDLLIIESTYGDRAHEPRKIVEEKFVQAVMEVVEGGGVVLIPAFAYGRAQEIMCVLYKYLRDAVEVYVDGMAKALSRELLDYHMYLKDFKLYKEALKKVRFVKRAEQRAEILKKKGVVVISPAGMLRGGPSTYYASILADREDSAIFLVSYQIPGTPGHSLLNYGKLDVNRDENVRCRVEWFDFSSHLGQPDLINFISSIVRSSDGLTDVLLVHGEESSCNTLASLLKDQGISAKVPLNGETLHYKK